MKRITTELVDDLDGTIIGDGQGGTVSFAHEGRQYELDLTAANAEKLREALAPFVAKARSAGSRRAAAAGSTSRKRASSGSSDTQAIREWAQANGHPVGDRGRISTEIREAYAAANA
ncbi:Lsr2 family protein [Microcella daejeonensis]|uniref:histone-like nucleoid-structuring protein Lsr2 n=1 Tax=Microcella daejeonensis TaxID=2994971 RepID=UPI002271DC86|nr:Lsr2 family protein [Microcella daejeonensis]WAB84209.1 Lsr2 family protein [Microcella daejeonensis]